MELNNDWKTFIDMGPRGTFSENMTIFLYTTSLATNLF